MKKYCRPKEKLVTFPLKFHFKRLNILLQIRCKPLLETRRFEIVVFRYHWQVCIEEHETFDDAWELLLMDHFETRFGLIWPERELLRLKNAIEVGETEFTVILDQ